MCTVHSLFHGKSKRIMVLVSLIPMNNQQQLLLQLHHHLQHPVIENNNKGCDYDGEDCCGENVNLY